MFIPENSKQNQVDVPYYDDVTSDAGWQGQSTGKSVETLKSEIIAAIGRLGGLVVGFRQGTFPGERDREGFQIHYTMETSDGGMLPGRIDIAALPIRRSHRTERSYETRRVKSLKMALYMLRVALDGTWFLEQLSPGYSALMPWMLANKDETYSEIWTKNSSIGNLLMAPEEDFVEGIVEQ